MGSWVLGGGGGGGCGGGGGSLVRGCGVRRLEAFSSRGMQVGWVGGGGMY